MSHNTIKVDIKKLQRLIDEALKQGAYTRVRV